LAGVVRPRPRRPGWAIVAVTLAVVVAGCDSTPGPSPTAAPSGVDAASVAPAASGASNAPPAPGHEIYGFLPYWEMDAGIAGHLATTPLTTLGLFSVTHAPNGSLRSGQQGYRRITGDLGRQLIREAHGRDARVELVYTSFGLGRNRKLFGDLVLQDKVIGSLVALAGNLGLDGINVDVEGLDPLQVAAYGDFVGRLRQAVVAADAADRVSVATQANEQGAAMAAAAVDGGVDRVFLMGYDYRTGSSSAPGATSPLARRDGKEKDLPWSLDLYATYGVPVDRLLLGLPLYGVTWPVAGPVIGAPATGRGEAWILRYHTDLLLDPSIVPLRDEIESVEVYLSGSDGSTGPPTPAPSGVPAPGPSSASSATPSARPPPAQSAAADVTWRAVYVDSPATLATKMQLALDRGLRGTGFWAVGYERGLPGYTELMRRFAAGEALP
jgi:hypothetical protein